MNRSEWVSAVAARTGLTKKQTKQVLDEALDVIAEQLAAGDAVCLTGFGQFETRERKARTCRGFGADEQLVEAAVLPVFRAGTQLKEKVHET